MDIKTDVVAMDNNDKKVHDMFAKAMEMTTMVTTVAVNSTDSASNAVYGSLGAALGCLQVTAALLSKQQAEQDDEEKDKAINQDTITLATALLLSCVDYSEEGGNAKFEFGVQQYKKALALFKQITGHDADDKFAANFVKAAKEATSHLH